MLEQAEAELALGCRNRKPWKQRVDLAKQAQFDGRNTFGNPARMQYVGLLSVSNP
jgi:hypothetical protein